MKRLHNAVLVVMFISMLSVVDAYSGSGSSAGSSIPTSKTPTARHGIGYTLNSSGPIATLNSNTCGGDAEILDGERFKIVLNGEAFIDRATCQIWEMNPYKPRSPYYDPIDPPTYNEAEANCNSLSTGGIYGWRLPNVLELAILVESIDGSVRPWEIDERCYFFLNNSVTPQSCYGWTSSPAIGGGDNENFVVYMTGEKVSNQDLNETAFQFCVWGELNPGLGFFTE